MSETWVLNDYISSILTKQVINFTSNGQDFDSIECESYKQEMSPVSFSRIYYGSLSTLAYDNGYGDWQNNAYKTITFETSPTGTLLTWLQNNGTKQTTEPTFSFKRRYKSDNLIGTGTYKFRPYTLTQQTTPEEPTEDELAGTWTFNETLNLSAELMPEEVIVELGWVDLPITADDGTEYSGLLFGSLNVETNEFTSLLYGGTEVYNGMWNKESDRIITINALLEEVKNGQALLEFLQNNGTKQGGATLISFTISGTSYQAEQGMTWQQWIDSTYNTGNYVVYNGVVTKMPAGTAGSRVTTDSAFNNAVSPTDIIMATTYYMGQAN